MFFLQIVVILLLVLAALFALVLQAQRGSDQAARERSLAVAETFANSPGTVRALRSPDPTKVLQPRAEASRKRSGVDFIVVVNRDGIRYTHPVPNRIGKKFIGTIAPALKGRVHIENIEGTIGPTVQVVVPVTSSTGSVVGIVSAGVKAAKVSDVVYRQLPLLLGAATAALALATGGAILMSRRLRRQTHGLGPLEMTRMYEHHDAVLHAVHEGVLIVDGEGRLLLANDEASRLLDLSPDAQGRQVEELGLEARIKELLVTGQVTTDEVLPVGDRLLAVNNRPTDRGGGPPGSVATFRDSTELRLLSSRVEATRRRLKLLYDATGGIGTTLDVTRTAEELAQVAVPRLADYVTVDLDESVLRGEEPGPNGSRSTKMRRAAFSGIHDDPPLFPAGELITFVPSSPQARSFKSGRAFLEPRLDQAPGWQAIDPERAARVTSYGIHSLIVVRCEHAACCWAWSTSTARRTPPPSRTTTSRSPRNSPPAPPCRIDNARRYTREHTMALALQRSLLPRGLPEQNAVEVAYRYLPAQAGVGGDWFDVIPLSGARVALVVGDVVGHGLHAAATMGRLRTAVHNFAALDLPPDELLTHLDDLVARIDQDEAGATATEAGDHRRHLPVRRLRPGLAARAPWPAPATPRPRWSHPDGTVDFPDLPAGPPLGLGGLPFESAELHLPEGSQLVLYTDGLIEDRDRDIDAGLELLRDALARPGPVAGGDLRGRPRRPAPGPPARRRRPARRPHPRPRPRPGRRLGPAGRPGRRRRRPRRRHPAARRLGAGRAGASPPN